MLSNIGWLLGVLINLLQDRWDMLTPHSQQIRYSAFTLFRFSLLFSVVPLILLSRSCFQASSLCKLPITPQSWRLKSGRYPMPYPVVEAVWWFAYTILLPFVWPALCDSLLHCATLSMNLSFRFWWANEFLKEDAWNRDSSNLRAAEKVRWEDFSLQIFRCVCTPKWPE